MIWRLDKHVAQLEWANLTATVDSTAPRRGLWQLSVGGVALRGAELLALHIGGPEVDPQIQLLDCFIRGSSLCTKYHAINTAQCANGSCSMSLQAVWRPLVAAHTTNGHTPAEPGLELLVLANCESLECSATLEVRSRLAECETAMSVEPAGPGALLFRLPGGQWSYTQMIHPLDDQGVRVTAYGERGLEVIHPLFATVLEKGVIWVARLRGLFLARQHDETIVAHRYAEFAAVPPPLGDRLGD
jgi:hypothetical protein